MISLKEYKDIVRKRRHNVTLVLKVTNRCPLNCSYCYHLYNNNEDMGADMSIEMIRESVLKIAPYYKYVNIHVHGGEPLSLSNERLEEIFKFLSDYREAVKDYQVVKPAVQTNLVFYDKEKAELLKKYNIGLSTSFDGMYNEDTRGLDVEKAIVKLNSIKNKGIINVVTKEVTGKFEEQMDTFCKLGRSTVMSNAVFPFCCPQESLLKPGDYAEYVIKRFKYQTDNDLDYSWDVLRYMNSVINEGKGSDCFCSYCLNSIFTINPSGRIQGCDVRHEDQYFYGNIKDINKVEDIFSLDGYQNFEKMTYDLLCRCSNCKYYEYCNGGCFNRCTISGKNSVDLLSKDSYCYDIKLIIEYFLKFFEKYENDKSKIPEKIKKCFKYMEDKEKG